MTVIQKKLIVSESKILKECWPPSPGGKGQCTAVAEASLATLMATHNLPLGTIIFDGFLPFLTLFTTF